MNKLTLFWSIGSQPGRAVKTLLDIGRIPHQSIRINVAKLEHKGQAYLKIYPLGKIPAIKDGDFVLGESNAILTYICEKYPQIGHLHGRTTQERAVVNQYLSWYQNNFRLALFKPFRKFLIASISAVPIKQQEIIQQSEQMWSCIEQFQQIMSGNKKDFICGNTPSIADFLYYYELTNLQYFKVDHLKYEAISKWFQRVKAIDQVGNIMKQWEILAKERAQAFEKILPIRNIVP